ncbi:MAG: NTP transferase domain-containing protein [Agarilytica sp.]
MKSIAIIGARLNSSRLPSKHLLPLAGKPLIEQSLSRLQQCSTIDKLILATTCDNFNRPLVEWAESHIECTPFTGDVNDLMGRIDAIVKRENPDYIIYICGDCPLVAPDFIDHSIRQLKAHPSKEKIDLKSGVKSIHEGIEIYSIEGWNKLIAMSNDAMTREHVGYANKLNPTLDTLFIDDSDDYSKIDHRISVDTAADYEFMSNIYTLWYETHDENSIVDLKWVQQQITSDTTLKNTNAHVVQKNPQLQYRKIALFCHVSEKIGIGHLKRCSTIASALQENLGFGTTLHIHGVSKSIPWLKTKTLWYESEKTLLNAIKTDDADLWILDFHPSFIDTSKLEALCRNNTKSKIIAIDKLEPLIDVVDQLYIPAFYSNINSEKVNYGWQNYFVDLPDQHQRQKQQVTVLTGGADAQGYGNIVPKIVEQIVPSHWDIIWVQGPYAPSPALPNPQRWTLIKNPDGIQQYIVESSLILSCYGLSLFESIATQNLTILMPPQQLCDDEELKKLEAYDVCLVTRTLEELKTKITHYFTDKNDHTHITKNAASIFSGGAGKNKISSLVKQLLSSR